MTRFTLDAAMLASLPPQDDIIEFRDEKGALLGYFHPATPAFEARLKSPNSREDLERLRKEPGGRKFSDVVNELKARNERGLR